MGRRRNIKSPPRKDSVETERVREAVRTVKGCRESAEEIQRYIESLLGPSEAGELLGTSGQWVTQMARAGKVRAYRTALGWLIDPDDLKRVANERAQRLSKESSKAARFAERFYERYGETMSELAKH
jgi:hypothetical protein